MAEHGYGLRFRETMAGYMGPGQDFRSGYERGKASGNAVAFTATIAIDDLDRFLGDPEHEAAMTALVDYAALGFNLRADKGRFHLFCRRNGHKRILYYLPFACGEEGYLLFGQKFIGDRPGLAVWRDMTTLHVELCRQGKKGRASGPVLSRGILTISLAAVLGQLSTFRLLGRPDPLAALSIHARFLASFTLELADTYGRRLFPN